MDFRGWTAIAGICVGAMTMFGCTCRRNGKRDQSIKELQSDRDVIYNKLDALGRDTNKIKTDVSYIRGQLDGERLS